MRKHIFLNPDRCERVIDDYEKRELASYDLMQNLDYRVSVLFRDIKKSGLLDFLMHSSEKNEDSFYIALIVLDIFKDWVENNKGWEQILLAPTIQREKTVQRLIHLCGKKICDDYNYDFTFEPNEGPGPADIKISRGANDKTIIEIKLNTNQNYLHGYEEQIIIYEKAEKTNKGIYVYIKVENHEIRDAKLNDVYKEKIEKGETCPLLYVIDSREQSSASKR